MINFGMAYGASPQRLSRIISQDEAAKFSEVSYKEIEERLAAFTAGKVGK
jgi:hypothetical protein